MVVVDIEGKHFYIDETASHGFDKVRTRVRQKDEDYFFIIDGPEGSGKSVIVMQFAKYADHSFNLDRVVFTAKDFQEAILKATKGQAIVFDEAFRGLSSRAALSEVNRLLVALMMECRQKNLIVFLVLPTFFLLDKYAAMWRSHGLFHVYRKNGKRGFWVYFNRKKKNLLYLKGHANYSYAFPKSSFKGQFFDHYVVDEKEYREKKGLAFNSTTRVTKAESFLEQRNLLLWYINRECGLSTTEISKKMSEYGWNIKQSSVSEGITKKEYQLKSAGKI